MWLVRRREGGGGEKSKRFLGGKLGKKKKLGIGKQG